jgi:very-short-patch-repair endonuclease
MLHTAPNLTDEMRQTIESWQHRLVDFSHMNPLLYFKESKSILILPCTIEHQLLRLINGETETISLAAFEFPEKTLRMIARKAHSNAEERGIATLFIAIGLLQCRPQGNDDTINAPLLLLPVMLTEKVLTCVGEPQINETLRAFFAKYDTQNLPKNIDWGAWHSLAELCQRITALIPEAWHPTYQMQIILGNFIFQNMEIAEDIADHHEDILNHPIGRALLGDKETQNQVIMSQVPIDARTLDRRPVRTEYAILDADSSQQQVIVAIEQGQSGVIQGPPGTGKSQTLANIIATAVAHGQSVLFVAEKKAAIDVIEDRLKRCGLGHLCLNLFSIQQSAKRTIDRVNEAMERVQEFAHSDFSFAPFDKLEKRRASVNGSIPHLYHPQCEVGKSVQDLMTLIIAVRDQGWISTFRFSPDQLANFGVETHDLIESKLNKLAELHQRIVGTCWEEMAPFPTGESLLYLHKSVMWLREWFRDQIEAIKVICKDVGSIYPETVVNLCELVNHYTEVASLSAHVSKGLWEIGLLCIDKILTDPCLGFAHWRKKVINRSYRQIWQRIDACFAPQTTQTQKLASLEQFRMLRQWCVDRHIPMFTWVTEVQRTQWRSIAGLASYVCEYWDSALADSTKTLVSCFESYRKYESDINAMCDFVDELAGWRDESFINELFRMNVPKEQWMVVFLGVWAQSWLDFLIMNNRTLEYEIRGFQTQAVKEFQDADKAIFQQNALRLNAIHAERAFETMKAQAVELQYLRQVTKKKRGLPNLPILLKEAPHIMSALFPCIMASPLIVSQLIRVDTKYFDLVLVDEASQILPEHAIMPIIRGKQVVIAGDRYQLPPTRFFTALEDELIDEDIDTTEMHIADYESLLDLMSSIFRMDWYLRWHYRSHDERLIACSNALIYKNQLVTFPGTQLASALRLVKVDACGGGAAGTQAECDAILKIIEELSEQHPNESFGIITFGRVFADRLQDVVDTFIQTHPQSRERYLNEHRPEPYFIKSIEQVQGDERDHIILAVGFGKNDAGIMRYNFGPINQEFGQRRLNVAVTRARLSMTVVSTFTDLDMDPEKCVRREGLNFLRHYLGFVRTGGEKTLLPEMTTVATGSIASMNPFERDIYEKLSAHGMHLIPQVGVSQYRIDFGVTHPERLGEFLMAIECDGARYHSSPTARDRDRLRQKVLEQLGWHFHRIWSTDWFYRQQSEINRCLLHYHEIMNGTVLNFQATSLMPVVHPIQTHERGAKPNVPHLLSIDQYSFDDLCAILNWIESDNRARLDDELKQEMVRTLGYQRLGPRIDRVLSDAIARYHALMNVNPNRR